jgi:hypothetical protein
MNEKRQAQMGWTAKKKRLQTALDDMPGGNCTDPEVPNIYDRLF